MKSESGVFTAGIISGAAICAAFSLVVGAFTVSNAYKRGQTDAMYGNWHYARAKDANGNEYVVEVPEVKR